MKSKKLQLKREELRELSHANLAAAGGGGSELVAAGFVTRGPTPPGPGPGGHTQLWRINVNLGYAAFLRY